MSSSLDLYYSGQQVWLQSDPSKDSWTLATIESVQSNDGEVCINLTNEQGLLIFLKIDKQEGWELKLPPLRNPAILDGIDDLTLLPYLHEPAVLHNLNVRYTEKSTIYTYSGIVLVAINPFQPLSSLYSKELVDAYNGKQRGELEPHLFAIAEDALRSMKRGRNQSIIVSGESGAGKTVSAKYIMRYVATIEGEAREGSIETQVLATNPIMEAFGNAKTVRNDNSSRFGKYIEIRFDSSHRICGAFMRTFLLEKSRVTFQADQERNYHIFYQLLSGASDADLESFGFTARQVSQFWYLNQREGQAMQNYTPEDKAEFSNTLKALKTIGICDVEQKKLLIILCVILHIGNISIAAGANDSSVVETNSSMEFVCKSLKVDFDELKLWLTRRKIQARGESIIANLNLSQAVGIRDALSKYLYSLLFDWIVDKINASLDQQHNSSTNSSAIGVLDIYGFEHFQHNSFEQFCINWANERLQQEFNKQVFKLEQQLYVQEAIEWSFINFNDNQPCIDLIEGKMGIIDLLDEECRIVNGTDLSFTEKVLASASKSHGMLVSKTRFLKCAFIVNHFAYAVVYETDGFVEKNKDIIPDDLMNVLEKSTDDFVSSLISSRRKQQAPLASGKKHLVTLGSSFKVSLSKLMETINSTEVHYIRCIKPNEAKTPFLFDSSYILQQLRACGVLETIRISCAGYPSRWVFEEFISRYYMLTHSKRRSLEKRELCCLILKDISVKYQVGKTKIFFRAGQLPFLEKLRNDRLTHCAILMQKNIKRFLAQKIYERARNSLIWLQVRCKGFLVRRAIRAIREENSSIKIQACWRAFLHRREFKRMQTAAKTIQSVYRSHVARLELLKIKTGKSLVMIQATCKMFLLRKKYKKLIKSCVLLQSLVRRKLARKQLVALKIEAKSANHFKEISYHFENKVIQQSQQISELESQLKSLQEKYQKEVQDMQKVEKKKTKQLLAEKEKWLVEKEKLLIDVEKLKVEGQNMQLVINQLQVDNSKLKDEIAKSAEVEKKLEIQAELLREENESLKTRMKKALEKSFSPSVETAPTKGYFEQSDVVLRSPMSASKDDARRRTMLDSLKSSSSTSRLPCDRKDYVESPLKEEKIFQKMFNSQESDNMLRTLLLDLKWEKEVDEILHLKVPIWSDGPVNKREILLFANTLGTRVASLWKFAFLDLIQEDINKIMRTTRHFLAKFEDLNLCAFWMSNLLEFTATCRYAKDGPDRPRLALAREDVDFDQLEVRMMKLVQEMEKWTQELYAAWLKEEKKIITKLAIPAVIEHQGLPGFTVETSAGFFGSMFTPSSSLAITIDQFIAHLDALFAKLKFYFSDFSFISQFINSILRHMSVVCFNQLLIRKNFCTWKRGMQIQYNLTRIEEWCAKQKLQEGPLNFERLSQASKLLQLNKGGVQDVETIFDVCFLLSATQIKKIMALYYPAEFESPVSPQLIKAVASRAVMESASSSLGEDSVMDSQENVPLFITPKRELTIDRFIPKTVSLPLSKNLFELVASGAFLSANTCSATSPSTAVLQSSSSVVC